MPVAQDRYPGFWIEIGMLVVVLVVAGFLRFTQLDTVPPGMTHDEAAFGAEAERILAGERPIYFSLGYGHEPVYAYLVALAFSLMGRTLIALRTASAACGLLVVLGTYLLARQMYGVRTAWVSAAWMAVAFWPLSLSRQALRAVTLPMLWLPAAWAFWRSVGREWSAARSECRQVRGGQNAAWRSRIQQFALYALSGLFLGATVYTYMASRASWAVFPLFVLYLLLRGETRAVLKRTWRGVLVVLAVAGLVALPLVVYLRAHPMAEVRVGVMMDPIRELLNGKPQRVLRHAWNALRAFSWIGDRFWGYNVPGRPIFNWMGSLLFYAGLGIALWWWRDPRAAFLVIWLIVGMAPAMVTTNEGIFLRAIVAQPVTYVLVAVALSASWAWLRSAFAVTRFRHRAAWLNAAWVALAVGLVAMEGVRTYRAYFVDWPSRPEVRNIYNHALVASARYLQDQPEGGTVGISALYPLYYHDPWIVRYVAERDDLALRWFDGRGGIVYPAEGTARYVFSALTPLDPALRAEFTAQATLIERRELAPDDQNPYFEVWRWAGAEALARHLDTLRAASPLWISSETVFDRPESRRELESPVRFGDVMALVSYRLGGTSFQPGDVVELVTYWRALRTVQAEDDWVSFVHLLDANSGVIGSVDVLNCPPTGWLPGDIAVQVHRFAIDADAAVGQHVYLEAGVYRRTTGRLPVMVSGEPSGDRVLLAPLEVR
jgi:4-amino-4-deoxy-L-arabinose transferase-like glycosyltransferase